MNTSESGLKVEKTHITSKKSISNEPCTEEQIIKIKAVDNNGQNSQDNLQNPTNKAKQ